MNKHFPILYIDLDGVLADLYGYAAKIHKVGSYRDINSEQWEIFFKEVNAEELFSNLEPFPSNQSLIKMAINNFGRYNILSSPLNFDKEGSIKGKIRWLKNNISTEPNDQWIFDHEKYKYAIQENGIPNILIDDYNLNIEKWTAAGGKAIKWQADEQSIDELSNMLNLILNKYFYEENI